ncbi:MAG: extracellular solute-binding protein [Inquilinus sp.]|nr:extracellular solute-binding protein [Inquilinus sp.]
MKLRTLALAGAMTMAMTSAAVADCAFRNDVPLKSLTAGFEAWKAVTEAMAECGNFQAELDQEFRTKQPAAFAADPALYHIGGVANATLVPLLNEGTIRPLDDLVARYGQNLTPNQLIKVDGQVVAVAMMVNTQHLMYRADILDDLGIAVPATYDEVLAAAEKIRAAGVVEYPLGATFKTGWNLGEDFINTYLGFGGAFFGAGNQPAINNDQGVATLELMKRLTEYMDPEYLVSDSTYVQQQFQQGKIAMANLWASRAGAMDDAGESQVVGKVMMASAPAAVAGGRPASTLWWDGIVIASNITDQEAEAAFRVAMEGLDRQMVQANNDVAVWLVDGFAPGRLSEGAIDTATAGAVSYPAGPTMGLMHTALGNNVADFLTGAKDARTTLRDIEAEYLTAAREAGLVQ